MQAFWRKINEHSDIRARYGNEENFNLMLKMLPALAFLPSRDVVIGYIGLRSHTFFVHNETLLQPIFTYFERTYIGHINNGIVVSQPLFAIETWNVYDATINNMGRTNNSVEGWHNAFCRFVGSNHPNIFNFLQKLKEYEALNRALITQISIGSTTRQTRRKYRDLNLRIHTIAITYDPSNKVDYLKRISHNLNF
ncbi:hypothetical protein RF11_16440 [Thelohanellus kitauei]|uniref:MULE domain-containing protein n=1 Tax=Thelohanellus kitauei TaxID=669202 RepID=A0A0C2IWB4_THEKT|nr:hypothetical protein RF11_16440 [Thelohanellus kitauei]